MQWSVSPFDRPHGRWVYDAAGMRAVDVYAIEGCGIPGTALMEAAGGHVARVAARFCAEGATVLVVAGGGNNGGDGFVAARHLASWGYRSVVILQGEPDALNGDASTFFQCLTPLGIPVHSIDELPDLIQAGATVVVDALLGTGLKAPLRGALRSTIDQINRSGIPVVAVDLPSGVCSDTGMIADLAIEATVTVTFGSSKLGQWLFPGSAHIGRLEIVDIGLPVETPSGPVAMVMGPEVLDGAFFERPANAHKGQLGRVLALGGDAGKTGAIKMAADAALVAGAGLVTIGTTEAGLSAFLPDLYEVMASPCLAHRSALLEAASRSDALVVGPGYPEGLSYVDDLLALLADSDVTAVVDAGALSLLARDGEAAVSRLGAQVVITPHPGEAGRLLRCSASEVQADRMGSLRALVKRTGAICVLKGAHTLVGTPDGGTWICPAGNAGMASAGTGDVLAGVIGALLARGWAPARAAKAGVYWHSRAGDVAAMRVGQNGMRARDVIAALAEVEKLLC